MYLYVRNVILHDVAISRVRIKLVKLHKVGTTFVDDCREQGPSVSTSSAFSGGQGASKLEIQAYLRR